MRKFKLKHFSLNQFLAVASLLWVGLVSCGLHMVVAAPPHRAVKPNSQEPLRASDEKVIEWLGVSKQEVTLRPYQLENFFVRKSEVTPYLKFNVKERVDKLPEKEQLKAEDWLEGLQLTIRNRADKPITFVLLELGFPETEAFGPKMVYQLKIGLGMNPGENEIKFVKPLRIPPGESYVFTLPPQHLKGIKDFLGFKNFRLGDLNRLEILSDLSIFDDGIMWANGHFYKPNPSAPNGYERITP
jgi:hypothetical protein